MRLTLILSALMLSACGADDQADSTPKERPKASATPSTDRLRADFAKQSAATEPPLKNRAVRRCFEKSFDRYGDERFRRFATALEKGEAGAQEQVGKTARRCAARAGIELGATQDLFAEQGADVDCALARLRRSLTPGELERAAEGRLSDKAARAVADALAACR
jgi:hypothetical protein